MSDKFKVLKSRARHGSLRVTSLFRRQSSVTDEDERPRFLSVQADRSALVHQRSSESHDSTTSGVSMQSAQSGSSADWSGGSGKYKETALQGEDYLDFEGGWGESLVRLILRQWSGVVTFAL